MADKKENDFWGNSEDDFWNKPVITGDWLNSTSGQEDKTTAPNPYADTNTDPYWNTYQEEAGYGIPNQPAYTYQQGEKAIKSVRVQTQNGNPEKKKNFPVFLVLNLFFFFFTALVVSVCILVSGSFQTNAQYRNRQFDYETVQVEGNSFPVYSNNVVTLAHEAGIVFSQDSDKHMLGMPAGEMMIAIPVQVESDEYQYGQYALRDMFIGYQQEEGMTFRRCIRDEVVFSVLAVMGFDQGEIISSYGVGNGSDEGGFVFFFVPEGTREITFYAEERKTEQGISVLTRRYEKELSIYDIGDVPQWLEEIREGRGER